uniref:tRNA-synt_1 domain-containing protein n=1 Tax=Globodera pallida TaxID=36090 RepID=A0A183CH20_GLOPA
MSGILVIRQFYIVLYFSTALHMQADFILRSRVQLGQRVRYRPGWDCHGLTIELKIQRQQSTTAGVVNLPSTSSVAVAVADNPLLVRHSARQVANASIRSQMDTFLAWGCIGDFARPYLTMQPAMRVIRKVYIVASALVPHISKEFGFDIA